MLVMDFLSPDYLRISHYPASVEDLLQALSLVLLVVSAPWQRQLWRRLRRTRPVRSILCLRTPAPLA